MMIGVSNHLLSIVFRFHETVLSFGEPGSLGYSKLRYQDGKWTDGNRPMVYLYLIYHRNQSNIPGRFHFNIPVLKVSLPSGGSGASGTFILGGSGATCTKRSRSRFFESVEFCGACLEKKSIHNIITSKSWDENCHQITHFKAVWALIFPNSGKSDIISNSFLLGEAAVKW